MKHPLAIIAQQEMCVFLRQNKIIRARVSDPFFVTGFYLLDHAVDKLIDNTHLGQHTPSRLPGSNQQSSPFSNRENPLTHLLNIDPFLSLHVPPNSSKEWF